MPRFPEESVSCLKRTMLARQPSFVFTTKDVENIIKETGLDKAQIWVWADNLRHRFKIKKLDDTLDFLRSKKEEPIKVKRFFVSCFDVTPDFASTFEYRKSDEKDVNPIVCMEAAFNREVMCGEFFIEFKNAVKDIDLVECLQNQEAKGVNVFTFPNDDGETASDAIIRVLTLQCKTGLQVARGKRPEKLNKRVDVKQKEAAKEEELGKKEFGEKEAAAIKNSLEGVSGDVKDVKDVVHSCEVKLESCEVEIVEMKHDVKSQGVVMNDIKDGFCNVIPDLQEKIAKIEKVAEYHKTQRDIQEGKTAAQTTKVNRLNEILAVKDAEILSLQAREDAHLKREDAHLNRIKELEGFLELLKSIENVKQITLMAQEDRVFLKEELAFTRAERAAFRDVVILEEEEEEEERAAKRPRV